MNKIKIISIIAMMMIAFSFNAQAEESKEKTCDEISAMGNMIMQVRQYKPEVSSAFLLSKINKSEEAEDISPEDKDVLDKSKKILTSIIEKAYEIEVVEGNQNKKNSIIAFQVQVFEYCLTEI